MAKSKIKHEPHGNYRFLLIVAAALFFAFIINTFFYCNTRVVGNSMSPFLKENDWIIVEKQAYKNKNPQFGEIVVLRKTDVTNENIIKRVIGLPNDTLEIKSGVVYINGKALEKDFSPIEKSENMAPIKVPNDSYFVMGDNRPFSNDSRKWKNPFVKKNEILGKAIFRYFPGYLNLRQQ